MGRPGVLPLMVRTHNSALTPVQSRGWYPQTSTNDCTRPKKLGEGLLYAGESGQFRALIFLGRCSTVQCFVGPCPASQTGFS